MVAYLGEMGPGVVFDPALLTVVPGQIKFKIQADTSAEQDIQPIGLPRDLSAPLPYLALFFELGNESSHGATKLKIKATTPAPTMKNFQTLVKHWQDALDAVECYRKQHPKVKHKDVELVKLVKMAEQERQAMDGYNRYTIAVRGASASIYGILDKANVKTEFAALLGTTMPSPTIQDTMIQHMRPLERLGSRSDHTAWMSRYVVGDGNEDTMDVDP
jgi:hypothetical protein